MNDRARPYSEFRSEVEFMYRHTWAKKTYRKIRQVLREFEEAGAVSMSDLRPPFFLRWIASHPERSYWTKKSLLASARAAFTYAVDNGFLDRSPLPRKGWKYNLGTVPELADIHHSAEALGKVFERANLEAPIGWKEKRLRAVFATAALTGMRKLEILRLQVQDIDLEAGVLEIVPRVAALKTPGSGQPIPCPDLLIEYLRDWMPHAGPVWLFPNCYRTNPWTEGKQCNKPLECLKALGERAGVDGLTFQSLRHSWATHAESLWGIEAAVIQRVLRHTTLRTQKVYRHADLPNLRAKVRGISFARPPEGEGVHRGQATAV